MSNDSLSSASDTCERCGHVFVPGAFEWPWCPHGTMGAPTYFQDDIPGGLVIENLGPTPVKVYSHTERRKIMRARGLEEYVRHVDGSPHTVRWVTMDEKTLENATILVSRQNSSGGTPEPPDHVVRPDGTAIQLTLGNVYRGVLDHE